MEPTQLAIKHILECPNCVEAIRQRPDCDFKSVFGAYLRVRKGLVMQQLIDWEQVTKDVKNELQKQ
jgi:hypothetical protein